MVIEIHTRQTGMMDRMLTEMAAVINSGEEYIIAGTSSYKKAQKIMKTWDGWNINPHDTKKINGFKFFRK